MPDHGQGVLIVEDEAELRLLFSTLLEIEEYKIFQACDGIEGLAVLRANIDEIVLLISDLGLPHMGGVDLISKAHALKPSLKIIGTSGLGTPNVREMVLAAGGNTFIPKPFLAKDVIEKVRALMSAP